MDVDELMDVDEPADEPVDGPEEEEAASGAADSVAAVSPPMVDPARVKRSSNDDGDAGDPGPAPPHRGGRIRGVCCANATNRLDVYSLRSTCESISLKGQCHDIFASGFFMNHLLPVP